jgi:hypothetical protein
MERRTFLKTAATTSAAITLANPTLSQPFHSQKDKPKIMVWAHANTDFLGEDHVVKAEFEKIRESGIDVILLFVHSHPQENQAWYNASLNGFVVEDRLSRTIKISKEVGVEIHPIVLGMKDIGLSELNRNTRSYKSGKPGGSTKDGRTCSSWQTTLIGALRIASDIISHNNVPGFHLDYIRYVDTGMGMKWPCSCEACKQNYKRYLGKSDISSADLLVPGMLYQYLKMRNENIRDAVVQFKKLADQHFLKLSMAARADYFGSALVEGQDWINWGHEGLFDFICPMNYTTDRKKHKDWLSMQLNLMDGKTDIYSGIGRLWSGGETETTEMIKQADDAFSLGAAGICLFHYRGLKDKDFTALKSFSKKI